MSGPDEPGWSGEPAAQGARHLALALLERASAARVRLADAADEDALHDFRVGIRRLRSALQTFEPELADAAGKRERRRWRNLARSTGPSRDAEAQSEWLARAEPGMRPPVRSAARETREALAAARAEESGAIEAAGRRFDRLAQRLRGRLATYTAPLDPPAAPASFGGVSGERSRDLGRGLGRALLDITGAHDVAGAHAARIAAKRLRYALEAGAPAAESALARLKTLQDLLGELHDIHGLMGRVTKLARRRARARAAALAELAIEQGTGGEEFQRRLRRREPSWWSLLDALRRRQEELFVELERRWLAGGEGRLATVLDALVAEAVGAAEE
jgi:CHAD domain-containing protein